jgi:CBS domain-containing protein
MSPRAARRLERFGFEAYDYAAGKVDWLAAGMPTVRPEPGRRRALEEADRDPPTCGPEAAVGTISATVLVVNDQRVLLGRIPPGDHPPTNRAEQVMQPGPATVRAHEPLDALLERMTERDVHEIAVTTPEGPLLGVVRRP